MNSIKSREKAIITEFESLPDIDAKYQHLFQLGNQLPDMDPGLKTDENLVRGCQSKLWFHFTWDDRGVHLEADSDSMVIKGIAALLVKLIEGLPPQEVEKVSMDFIDELQIWKLASERNNGLMAMLEYIRNEVKTIKARETQEQVN
ncbi:MAG: SufE family protein [Chloroflexota bacterium]|nr:SufE family protein [Chloroflexota bacterium]